MNNIKFNQKYYVNTRQKHCLLRTEIHTHLVFLAKYVLPAQQKNAFKNESKLVNNNIIALALVPQKII